MAESERPDDEREDVRGASGEENAPVSPDVDEDAPAAQEPDAEPAAQRPPAATPGPAGDEGGEEALPAALEAAAQEVPESEGPGEGVTPQPPSGDASARERPLPTAPDAPDGAEEVVPGAHLEPDLVLDERRDDEPQPYADPDDGPPDQAVGDEGADAQPAPAPIASTPMDLAADARYRATGKRKSSVARVILRPGSGSYTVNGRPLGVFFPRPTLQKRVQQPLETAGYESRMDVVAKIHGGGVSSQAGALRHGVARALVEADPNLRQELKRRGFLTRDARVKERKKAGLKKARKRPQFSKR